MKNTFLKIAFFSTLVVSAALPAWSQVGEQFSTIGSFSTQPYEVKGESKQLKIPLPTDQFQSEECGTFAFANLLNVRNFNKMEDAPRISGEYLFFRKLEAHVDYRLAKGYSIFDLEGADPEEPIMIALKYGIVPEESWTPRTSISNYVWDFPAMYKGINDKTKAWRKEIVKVAKQFGKDSKEAHAKLDEAKQDIRQLYLGLAGELPETFEYRGKQMTPKQFFKKYGFSTNAKVYLLASDRVYEDEQTVLDRQKTVDKFRESLGIKTNFIYSLIPQQNAPKFISSFIKNGQPALISSTWADGGHVYTIVGQEIRDKKVYAFKALQSWGASHAQDGANWFAVDDILAYADHFILIKD